MPHDVAKNRSQKAFAEFLRIRVRSNLPLTLFDLLRLIGFEDPDRG
jgi:hypothetical protein